jgi:small subunit ribosomal protein S6
VTLYYAAGKIVAAIFFFTIFYLTFATRFIKIIINKKEMLNQYETVFIATPVLSENQMKEAVQKFKKIITDNDGEIVHEENWGLKKLAYPIQKKSTGFYYLVEFRGSGELIEKLELQYRRDERIIRFLTFRLHKYALEYAEKKRRMKETAKTTEE